MVRCFPFRFCFLRDLRGVALMDAATTAILRHPAHTARVRVDVVCPSGGFSRRSRYAPGLSDAEAHEETLRDLLPEWPR